MIDRRQLVLALAALGLAPAAARVVTGSDAVPLAFEPARPFSFDRLVEKARRLAEAPYVPEVQADPAVLDRIDFDAHWKIKYRPEDTLEVPCGQAPVRLFHPGRYVQLPVTIAIVESGTSREVVYDPGLSRCQFRWMTSAMPRRE